MTGLWEGSRGSGRIAVRGFEHWVGGEERRHPGAIYIILSRFSPEAFGDPKDFKKLAFAVSARIRHDCPGVTWKRSFAILGRFDAIDIVESEDLKQVEKAAMIIRAHGHSTTETLVATPWKEFLKML